jgi:GTP-binding protein
MNKAIRNIAIIAHVDHGKTTLVDQLLRQSGTFRDNEKVAERVMDSNDIERERGITILAKNCAVEWQGTHINIVDTPGHADFGGEVERVLSMVDGVLLLVDASRGPDAADALRHPQGAGAGPEAHRRRQQGRPPGSRARLRDQRRLRPVRQARRHRGAARLPGGLRLGPERLGQPDRGPPARPGAPTWRRCSTTILQHVPAHEGDPAAPLQLQISSLDYSTYVGRIGIGRINAAR